ncbi:MAG: hypothetical protein IJT54_05090 [Candidatus Methanomethylophilaceae archaeon]|nr:hypothetical protein [Candidatus Methanomethylophilaceae archaeon]
MTDEPLLKSFRVTLRADRVIIVKARDHIEARSLAKWDVGEPVKCQVLEVMGLGQLTE